MTAEPLPCKACGRPPVVQARITDPMKTRQKVWIVGCLTHRWNHSRYCQTREIAIERWNEKQESEEE